MITFDDEFHVYVLRDRASDEAWWEMPDGYSCGFDAPAGPLRMSGEPHRVAVELAGEEPAEVVSRRSAAPLE
ncbi:hypothetical protein [Streptomyces sp. NPDC048737]|uniref:hypothetical protein n=1 Tax=unclassified Streptomyces TaxID=2593676 RepID=UPI00344858F4